MWAGIIGFILKLWVSLHDAAQRKLGRLQQKSEDLQQSLDKQAAMNQAAADSPEDKQSLIDTLRNGKVCLLLAALFLTSCAHTISSTCPAIRTLSPDQEKAIAVELANLPSNSKLIPALIEWARLRAEAKACKNEG